MTQYVLSNQWLPIPDGVTIEEEIQHVFDNLSPYDWILLANDIPTPHTLRAEDSFSDAYYELVDSIQGSGPHVEYGRIPRRWQAVADNIAYHVTRKMGVHMGLDYDGPEPVIEANERYNL
jgi:hypothetical protein